MQKRMVLKSGAARKSEMLEEGVVLGLKAVSWKQKSDPMETDG